MDPAGKDMTNIGRILGIIACVLMILGFIVVVGIMVLGGVGAAVSASSAG